MVNRAMNVRVVDYDRNWSELFHKEEKLIKNIFKDELLEIHHIGSTSVPNLKAKPIIDIMPVAENIENIDHYNDQMVEIGYEPLGEFGIAGRRYFRKGGENRTHQIHMFQSDNTHEIERHLAVRDYLTAHPEAAAEYGNLKARLAEKFPADIQGYMDGKDEFVKKLEQRALAWKQAGG
ncbi:GrpB family protein [Halobacillus salinarum]|uniref:GrpB family protein n=1 Tax=Halobacillus salinarum TaxID=2932257 RepID=A0ABY4ELG8_9BACI|nr:GrpB family protein [Halobacillus salinarum]UOQ44862.1 GrpB family protein [Halobacillus salinarum]